jgi:hypothetical protein
LSLIVGEGGMTSMPDHDLLWSPISRLGDIKMRWNGAMGAR